MGHYDLKIHIFNATLCTSHPVDVTVYGFIGAHCYAFDPFGFVRWA